jgi:hypothetical protein
MLYFPYLTKERSMLLNCKAVKQLIKEYEKQCSKEYLERLNQIVREKVEKSILNARQFKRMKASELI